ncbi:hypothetical protein GCM10011380_31670 [Sphingomonas metalli]|uniref:Phospholipase D-like domain-containing protein n=1 Tax=Sphingomonas metalli TaxID=1779358 RepID=A0A916WXC8_9SPHN|nr:phospholipase D-like domain-containing protein [Sphingomonas metalli]GGB39822.1 hypothetical protein GCM10011380_31670 [Sphingomonas metalli]
MDSWTAGTRQISPVHHIQSELEIANQKRSVTTVARAVARPLLVRNDGSGPHLDALERVIDGAIQIAIAVAFVKSKGLGRIVGGLKKRLGAGAAIEMFVGTDFCVTEPRALKDLLDLAKSQPKLTVLVAKPDARATFHPKSYLGVGAKGARAMVGSANLTGGALQTNEELSVLWDMHLADPLLAELRAVFDGYRANPRFEPLDGVVLDRYRRRFKTAGEVKSRIEKEIAAYDADAFDLATLASLHAEFSSDREEVLALERRRRDRKAALVVQRQIARMAKIRRLSAHDRETFEGLFRDLVTSADGHRHLWHSGDIHRRGQEALSDPVATIALFELAAKVAAQPPEQGYAKVRKPAADIGGVGINMVSEILCTFAPKRYAVFNGNTAAALRAIGADPPRSVTLFSAEAYARACGVVEAVRRRIGADDLSDADAFLNWIYQNKVKPAAGKRTGD